MKIPTGVADPVPTYRKGLLAALGDAGFHAEPVEAPEDWASLGGPRALLLSMSLPAETHVLAGLASLNEDLLLVPLLREPGLDAYRDAFRCGAVGAAGWDDTPESVVAVLSASLEGLALLPAEIARGLAMGCGRPTRGLPASPPRPSSRW